LSIRPISYGHLLHVPDSTSFNNLRHNHRSLGDEAKINGSYERYLPTCKVLEEVLAKTDPEERNKVFLGACVEYSKRQVGKKEPVFDREYGVGKSEEVYRHFIRMESKRLKGKGEEGEAGAVKVSQEKTVSEEKMANMV
jgi:hypothetical protein